MLIAVSLLATSKRAYRIRRSRPVAALLAGGWISVFIGVLLGPAGLGLLDREPIYQSVPLLTLGLGWIGFMVGSQLQWSLLQTLPRVVYGAAAADAVVTTVLVGTVAVIGLSFWIPEARAAQLALPAVFIVASSLGWALESRSLGENADERLAVLLRASGALLGVLAIALFGVATTFVERAPDALLRFAGDRAALKLLHTIAVAVAVGFIGRFMINMAGANTGYQLAIFLGLVAFTAGSAEQLDASPLIAAMLAGAVVANLPGSGFRRFETFIYKAEHTFAILFGVLAGLFLEPTYAIAPLALIAALVALRLLVKPALLRRVAVTSGDRSLHGRPLPDRSLVYLAAARQSPLMLALAVSLILIEPSNFHRRLLAVMVAVAVLSELLPLFGSRLRSSGGRDAAAEGAPA